MAGCGSVSSRRLAFLCILIAALVLVITLMLFYSSVTSTEAIATQIKHANTSQQQKQQQPSPLVEFIPLFQESLKDARSRDVYARLDRIREACGELCMLNDLDSIKARMVENDVVMNNNSPSSKQSFPRLVVPNVNCSAIMGCVDMDVSDYTFPKSISGQLMPYFTLGGATNYTQFRRFRRNSQDGGDSMMLWTYEDLEEEKRKVMLSMPQLKGGYGGSAALMVREKLRQLNITNLSVLVIGSESPWVEAICLGLGAARVTTLEYGPINCTHPQVQTLTPNEFRERYQQGTLGEFDAVVSHSSLEHSGLGRYGDLMNPWGDILAVARAWCVTKPRGKMYLGLPTGLDNILFNAHRVYGKVRWPLMAINWQQIDGDSHTDEEFSKSEGLDVANGGTGFLFIKD